MPYSANILIANFESDAETLKFQNFAIHKVTNVNLQDVRKKFPGYRVPQNGPRHHYIQRDYEKVPPHPKDQQVNFFGSIPFDSEDLMLLLRLFKTGDLGFEAQVIRDPAGKLSSQYPYPLAFSILRSTSPYSLQSSECEAFDDFFKKAPIWPGWNSAWFRVSRRYFLWGSSREFNIERDRIEDWELERILDFFIALEAALVPENDFVGRRLRERAVALLSLDGMAARSLKKRFSNLYGIRSTLAHGGIPRDSQVKTLKDNMPYFESDIRKLLKAALQCCPADEEEHKSYLKYLYDISDQERADQLAKDFKLIKTDSLKKKLLGELKTGLSPQSRPRKRTCC